MKNVKAVCCTILLGCVCVPLALWFARSSRPEAEGASAPHEIVPAPETVATPAAPRSASAVPATAAAPAVSEAADTTDDAADVPAPTDEDVREAEETKLVDAFDALTDAWQEPTKKQVSMADIKRFNDQFRKVPASRKDECLHRALNLIPDENIMLLAGILMDKSYDAEILDTVYGDVLNRAEEVKKPILHQIFKDKTHPCWADTAWILDVTDELPGRKDQAAGDAPSSGE